MEWDDINKILHSKCPRQQAFTLKILELLGAWEAAKKEGMESTEKSFAFLEALGVFINNWCPTLKDEYLP